MTGPKSGELSGCVHMVERQMLLHEERDKLVRDSHAEIITGPYRFITISRDIGALGDIAAAELAKRLQWQVYDKEIVDYIANDSHVRHNLVRQMDEKAQNLIHDTVDRLLQMFEGSAFGNEEYHVALLRSLATLAARGGLIILGHGGAFALQGQPGLHLRMTASLALRMERLSKRWRLSLEETRRRVLQTDADRREFIRYHFKADADDIRFFNAVFNTDLATVDQIVTAILGLLKPISDTESDHTQPPGFKRIVFQSSEDLPRNGLQSEPPRF
jgi:cytidylate kinase